MLTEFGTLDIKKVVLNPIMKAVWDNLPEDTRTKVSEIGKLTSGYSDTAKREEVIQALLSAGYSAGDIKTILDRNDFSTVMAPQGNDAIARRLAKSQEEAQRKYDMESTQSWLGSGVCQGSWNVNHAASNVFSC